LRLNVIKKIKYLLNTLSDVVSGRCPNCPSSRLCTRSTFQGCSGGECWQRAIDRLGIWTLYRSQP